MVCRRCLVLCLLVLLGSCVRERRLPVVLVTGGAGADVVAYELAVLAGADCPSAEDAALDRVAARRVRRSVFSGADAMALDPLDPGPYAFLAIGRDAACRPRLFGCLAGAVEGMDAIRIAMADPGWASAAVCAEGAACAAGRCEGPALDAGPPDGGPRDAGPDAGPDAAPPDAGPDDGGGPDADVGCGSDADCGPAGVLACVDRACVPRAPTIRVDPEVSRWAGYYPPLSVETSIEAGSRAWVHVAARYATSPPGTFAATVKSVPIDAFPDVAQITSLDDEFDDVTSLALRNRGTGLSWAVMGRRATDPNSVVAVGSMRPGDGNPATRLGGGASLLPLGPVLFVGGRHPEGARALYLASRQEYVAPSAVTLGGVPWSALSPDEWVAYPDAVPTSPDVGASGSRGRFFVMEVERDGDLLLFSPTDASSGSRLPRSTGRGRPGIAHLAGDLYGLAWPSGSTIAVTRLDCATRCTTFDAPPPIAAGGTVDAVDLTEMPGGAFLTAVVRLPGDSAIVAFPLKANLYDAIDPFVLYTLAAGERVYDLRATTFVEGRVLHLIVGAIIGPAAQGERLALMIASFERE
ncbi:MAG: hypothetical protein KF729_15745 [Sandaracinaceae bacterium]|nr:hypothetical protein [Sandaracinaceae bacterium]